MAIMGLDQVEAQEKAIEGMPFESSGSNSGRNGRSGGHGRGLVADAINVDHAANGNMGPVKDQGGCGSCWAFSAASTMEGTIGAKTGVSPPPRISEQQQVDCNGPSAGCQGGWMEYVYQHWKDHGAILNDDYGYTGQDEACKEDQYSKYLEPGDVKEWNQLAEDVAQIKGRLLQQPLSIAIHASSMDF